MTRRRSALVDEKQLAHFANKVELTFKTRLGEGAIKEGGYHNPNILSSTFEAVVGAHYLDNNRNIEVLRPLIEQLFESVPKDVMVVRSSIDSKNKLQEFVQANGATTPPEYETEQVGGMSHAPEFESEVCVTTVSGKIYGKGKGRNKKNAEKEAAADAVAQLKKRGLL